jgi:hypothetical protein
MIKYFLYISVVTILLSSCREININDELKNTLLLDALLTDQEILLDTVSRNKVLNCIKKSKDRIHLFESENLTHFQKQWLHHDKLAYQKIHRNLNQLNTQLDSIGEVYKYSKQQIHALREDLIHRHLNKKQFGVYFTDEQKILAELKNLSANLNAAYTNNTNTLDSLEIKLQRVLTQLDAIDSRHEGSAKK